MENEDCTPSPSQTTQVKQLRQDGVLSMDKSFDIMTQPKVNQQEKIRFRVEDIRSLLPGKMRRA